MNFLLCLSSIVILLLVVFHNNISFAIINGKIVQKETEYPFMVQVRQKPNKFLHGGVLVSPRAVLTVANKIHVFTWNTTVRNVFVVAGQMTRQYLVKPPAEWREARNISVPDRYFRNLGSVDYDIAVIWLHAKFKLNKRINIIKMTLNPPTLGWTCTIVGWGSINQTYPWVKESHLRKGVISTGSYGACHVMARNIICGCDNHNKTSSCWGDDGGPLVCRDGRLHALIWGCNRKCHHEIEPLIDVHAHRLWLSWVFGDHREHVELGYM